MATRRVWTRLGIGACLAISMIAAGCASNDSEESGQDPDAQQQQDETGTGGRIAGPKDGTDPTPGSSIVMAVEADPEGLDPTRYAFASSGHYVASAVYDSIATLDSDGNAVPFLAESITGSQDKTVWTISVREGVKFQNGTDADAEAIRKNLEAHRESIITKMALVTVTSIEVEGNDVVVELSQPWGAFPSIMTSQVGYVVEPQAQVDNTLAGHPVGTGPFSFQSRVEGKSWTFARNDNYWRSVDGQQLPYLDGMSFESNTNSAERVARLEQGDVDITLTLNSDDVLALRKSNLKIVEYDEGEEEFNLLNTEKPPFDNVTARRAVAYAMDTERRLSEIHKDVGTVAKGPFAPGQLGYLEDNGYPDFDMDEAKRLVKKYEDETGKPFEFQMLAADDPDSIKTARFATDLLEEAGMKVELTGLKQISLIAQTATGNYQMSAFRNFGFPDPDTDIVFWRSSSITDEGVSLNFPRFVNEDLDAALDAALAANDRGERDEAYKDMNRVLGDQVPYVWLERVNWILAAQTNVNGIYAAANGSIQTLGSKTWIGELWVQQ